MKTAIEIGNEIIAVRPQRALTKEEAKTLVGLVLLDKTVGPNLGTVLDEEFPFVYQVLAKRLQAHNVPFERSAAFFLASLADTPGVAVLYAAVIAAIAAKNDGRPVKLTDLTALDAFGLGLPEDEALHKIWDGQKINDGQGPDNMLDRKDAWA